MLRAKVEQVEYTVWYSRQPEAMVLVDRYELCEVAFMGFDSLDSVLKAASKFASVCGII